ncbi:hypothetical protein ACQP3L_30725, partial [Escherichia coli]
LRAHVPGLRVSITMINTTTKSKLEREGFLSAHSFYHAGTAGQELKVGTWRQELVQRPWRGAAYGLVPHGLLSLLSYRNHNGMGPPPSIVN